MGKRLELHEILVNCLGSRYVYFQPPSTKTMSYPCIVYSRNRVDAKRANNQMYNLTIGYMVIVIDTDPDSLIPDKISQLPMSQFERHYTSENLNHDVYNVYY